MSIRFLSLALLLAAAPAFAGGLEVGKAGADFALKDGDTSVTLAGQLAAEGTQAVVVWFASYACPYSLRAEQELLGLAAGMQAKGARLVALYPNRQEDVAGLKAHAGQLLTTWTALKDEGAVTAKSWGVEVTPTFFLFDKTGYLRYRGNLAGLTRALEQVLAGEQVTEPMTPATGCTVKWADEAVPATPLVPATPVVPAPPVAPPAPPAPPTPAGPEQPRPGRGERRAMPTELTPTAKTWLAILIGSLASEDEIVRRSAVAGIAALGPAAMPALRAARANAAEQIAAELDRAIARIAAGPGAGRGGEGGRGEAGGQPGGRFRGIGLDAQKQFLTENLDLSVEQKAALDAAFEGLKPREAELTKLRESGAGDPEAMREQFRSFMQDVRKALEEILTPEQAQKLEELRRQRGFGGRGGEGGPGGGGGGGRGGR